MIKDGIFTLNAQRERLYMIIYNSGLQHETHMGAMFGSEPAPRYGQNNYF